MESHVERESDEVDDLDRVAEPDSDPLMRDLVAAPHVKAPYLPQHEEVIAGRFEIKGKIAGGGFGVVYRAWDLQLKRFVAIKLFGRIDDPKRFLEEAQATAKIDSRFVVRIYDFGNLPTTAYLVLELLEGETLAAKVKDSSTLPIADALPLLCDMAAGLVAAHEKGVSHRDLTWSNVLVLKGDDGDEAKIIDLGLAEVLGELQHEEASGSDGLSGRAGLAKTVSQRKAGTPGFAPPERLAGREQAFQGDLWALGVIAYRILIGEFPFACESKEAYEQALKQTEAPRLREKRADMPKLLETLVADLLEKDPQDRPTTIKVRERLRDLREHYAPAQKRRRKPLVEGEPFRPLAVFEESDSELFLGRAEDTDALESLVKEWRCVNLHGESGAGKSSLVRAGLFPRLNKDTHCVLAEIGAVPDRAPLLALRDCITAELKSFGEAIADRDSLDALILTLGKRVGRRLLLVLDQVEEIFQSRTPEHSQAHARDLGAVITRVMGNAQVAVHWLLVIRGDYHGHLEQFKTTLPDVMAHGKQLLKLGMDASRAAVEKRFELAGFEIPRGLVEEILKDLAEDDVVDPVEMEIVCHALYERAIKRNERVLTRDDYERMGKGGKVLAAHLDQVEEKWPMRLVPIAQALSRALVSNKGVRLAAQSIEALQRSCRADVDDVVEALKLLEKARVVAPLKLRDGRPGYRLRHDKMALAVWERMGAEQQRRIAMREMLHRLSEDAPKGSYAGFKFAFWVWSGNRANREDVLRFYAENKEDWDDREKAFLEQLARWDRRAQKAPHAAVAALIVLVALSVSYGWAKTSEAREQKTKVAEAFVEAELEKDPGKAMAWIGEAARLRNDGEGKEGQRAFEEHWLKAQEAFRKGIGWVAGEHQGEVAGVMFSPSALAWRQATGEKTCDQCWPTKKLLFSVGKDGKARVLDLDRGGTMEELPDGSDTGFDVPVIAPHGQWFATGDSRGKVHVWEWNKDGMRWERHVLTPPAAAIEYPTSAIAVSLRGDELATGNQEGYLDIWETKEWKHKAHIHVHKSRVEALAFSFRDRRLYSLDAGGELRSTDPRTGENELVPLEGDGSPGHALAFSPEGDRLAISVSGRLTMLTLLDGVSGRALDVPIRASSPLDLRSNATRMGFTKISLKAGDPWCLVFGDALGAVAAYTLTQTAQSTRERISVSLHTDLVSALSTTRDAEWVATASIDGSINVNHAPTATTRTLRGHQGRSFALAISPDGRFVASGAADGQVRLWETTEGMGRGVRAGDSVMEILASHPDKHLVAGLESGEVVEWDGLNHPESKRYLRDREPGAPIRGLCEGEKGVVVAGNRAGKLFSWKRGEEQADFRVSEESVEELFCLSDGRIVQGGANSLLIWPDLRERPTLLGKQAKPVSALGVSPEGSIVSGSYDGTLAVWDVPTKAQRAIISLGATRITNVAVASEYEVLAASDDGFVWLWNWHYGSIHRLEPKHSGHVSALDMHVRTKLFATGTEDGSIRFQWLDSGVFRTLRGHGSPVADLEFSDDGRFLTSGSLDFSVRIWPLPPTDPAAFRTWLDAHTPYKVENGNLIPKPIPALAAGFGGPEPPAPTEACIEACIRDQPNDAPPDGETMETCVLRKRVPACQDKPAAH